MNNLSDFYDKLDLKYPEIAIAIDDINRQNPGIIRFIIPVLTPTMSANNKINKIIRQNKNNLMNDKRINLEISDIECTNYIHINVPQEVCNTYNEITVLSSDECNNSMIIEKGSKWIVVFIGGDISKPKIIARYLD